MAHFGEAVDYVRDCIIAFITLGSPVTRSILISFRDYRVRLMASAALVGKLLAYSWHDTQVLHQ
jgi:hypothetical protein